MRYPRTRRAVFLSRPNRFVALVDVDGETETVHVKNTGRCREILVPGAQVVLSESDNPSRRTRYDLVAVYKGDLLINIDSQAPNAAFGEFLPKSGLFSDDAVIRPEHTHSDSRFDFYVEDGERRAFLEVKGVTLEKDGVCMFPDAPTERGLKHIRGLERCVGEGYEAYAVFVVQMSGMRMFVPNYETHPEFGEELERAERNGVRVLVLECGVTEDSMTVTPREIPHSFTRSRCPRRTASSRTGPPRGAS